MKYFNQKPADITEIQLAILSTIVSNALGGKTKVEDFILSASSKKKPVITENDVTSLFRGLM